jgi:8-oxo-dGTP diphosphatase
LGTTIEQNILIAADTVVICKKSKVLLIKRLNPPFEDHWAFPGGFVENDEDLAVAASRELNEETSVNVPFKNLIQFKTYGQPGRDPRGRTVSVVYYLETDYELDAQAADDAKEAYWFDLQKLPKLAFDHSQILNEILLELKITV